MRCGVKEGKNTRNVMKECRSNVVRRVLLLAWPCAYTRCTEAEQTEACCPVRPILLKPKILLKSQWRGRTGISPPLISSPILTPIVRTVISLETPSPVRIGCPTVTFVLLLSIRLWGGTHIGPQSSSSSLSSAHAVRVYPPSVSFFRNCKRRRPEGRVHFVSVGFVRHLLRGLVALIGK